MRPPSSPGSASAVSGSTTTRLGSSPSARIASSTLAWSQIQTPASASSQSISMPGWACGDHSRIFSLSAASRLAGARSPGTEKRL